MCVCIYMGKGALQLHDSDADSLDAHRVCPQLHVPFHPSMQACHRVAVHCRALPYVVVCCSVLQCAAVTRAHHLLDKSLRAPLLPATSCRPKRGDGPQVVSKAEAQRHLVL